KDAVDILKGRLSEAGLRSLDVSSYIKTAALVALCESAGELPVSVVLALLPLVSVKGDEPEFVEGVSKAAGAKYVEKITADTIPAPKVRAYVQSWLGKGDKTEKAEWEKAVAYFDKLTDRTIVAALRKNTALFDRVCKAIEAVKDSARAEAA